MDKKGEGYENRVETNLYQIITAPEAKKATLRECFELQNIKHWDVLSISRSCSKRHFSQQRNTYLYRKVIYLCATAYTIE